MAHVIAGLPPKAAVHFGQDEALQIERANLAQAHVGERR